MPRLVATSLSNRSIVYRKWDLMDGVVQPLGSEATGAQFKVDWDDQIAPLHALLEWRQERLFVNRSSMQDGKSSIFYAGRESDSFEIMPGEGFVIGRTVFRLDPADAASSSGSRDSGDRERFYNDEILRTMNFDPTEAQLKAIRELVKIEKMDLQNFANRLVYQVKEVVHPQNVAVLQVWVEKGIVDVHTATGEVDSICKELVLEACRRQEATEYCWDRRKSRMPKYPMSCKKTRWAFCVPIMSHKEVEGDLAIYLSGNHCALDNGQALSADQAIFLQIVAEIFYGMQRISDLERQKRSTLEFFPKSIRNLLQRHSPERVLKQEQTHAAVLFCDLRGSCRLAENGSKDMLKSWNRLGAALSIMTEAITNQSGNIGDFQGDAAMGFWGWPKSQLDGSPIDLKEAVRSACQAADKLRERFRQNSEPQGPLEGFACGVGISSGDVVAGMLGTKDQRKISVFGPTVNLAARLESMTKQFGAAIILDEGVKILLIECDKLWQERLRCLGKVLPVGMSQPVTIFELMPPAADTDSLPLPKLKRYIAGQQDFHAGNWGQAMKMLEPLMDHDGPSHFLCEYIRTHQTPPADWDGTIRLITK